MKKPQWVVIIGCFIFFAILYWGFDTTTTKSTKAENTLHQTSGESAASSASPSANAKAKLTEIQTAELNLLESSLELQQNEESKIDVLQKLSGWWFKTGNIALAGDYAKQAAILSKKDEAWSIAGATYHQGLLQSQDEASRNYCAEQAAKAFETAQAIKPEIVEHQVNLALIYADAPPKDNPMKAVLMLRELEQKYPNAPAVYNALGRLALRTNQIEKALQRLEKAFSLDPKNKNAICLLAQAYEAAGQTDKAQTFAKKCQ